MQKSVMLAIGAAVVLLAIGGVVLAVVLRSRASHGVGGAPPEATTTSTSQPPTPASPLPSPSPGSPPATGDQSAAAPPPGPWRCFKDARRDFVPLRLSSGHDVECMAGDGKECAWKRSEKECTDMASNPISPLNPLTCGDMHKSLWGSTGYDDAKHWCSKGRTFLA